MPTYEYKCTNCNHEWEVEQRITEEPLRTCVRCGEGQAERQIPKRTGFALIGGGWGKDRYGSTRPR